jgi:hypothetical protein
MYYFCLLLIIAIIVNSLCALEYSYLVLKLKNRNFLKELKYCWVDIKQIWNIIYILLCGI